MITSATSPDHITIKWIEKATTKPNYKEKYLSSYLKKDDQHFETTSTAKTLMQLQNVIYNNIFKEVSYINPRN